jgi:hypothetical protein
MNRISIYEGIQSLLGELARADTVATVRAEDIFIGLRRVVMTISDAFQNGLRCWLLQDEEGAEITVLRVRKFSALRTDSLGLLTCAL